MTRKAKKHYRKYVRWFWGLYVGGILLLVLLFVFIASGKLGFMPSFTELENPEISLATQVISSDGSVLGTYYYQENRRLVQYRDISPFLINALISVEDERFYRHSGIDFRGLARVLVKSLIMGRETGGGSTITQQLGKLLFPREEYHNPVKFAIRKFREWVIAVKLEKTFTKEEILTLYLNKYDFIYNASGVESASYVYFNKPPARLNIEEAAVLAALAKNPSLYNPLRFEDNALKRRNLILDKMKEQKYADAALVDSVKQLAIHTDYHAVDHNIGPATYFREYLRNLLTEPRPQRNAKNAAAWDSDPLRGWCRKNFKKDGTPYNLYRDGLKIYTTIDSRMQQYAEEAVVEHLRDQLQPELESEFRWNRKAPFPENYTKEQINRQMAMTRTWSERYRVHRYEQGLSEDSIRKLFDTPVRMRIFTWKGDVDTVMTPNDSIRYYKRFLRAAFMAVVPQTGQVKAYVGGVDFRHFKYDQIMQGKRQVGSVFKPFVYTLAMEHGYSPCYRLPNIHYFIEGNFGGKDTIYQPKFSSTKELDGKMVTLKQGLGKSLNQISVWVIKQFNPESVINIARKMGIRSEIEPNWSICVGAVELPVYEVVGAFTVFANKGIWVKPYFVTRIEDQDGNLLASFRPKEQVAIDEVTAYKMLDMMQYTTSTQGTGRRLRNTYHFTNPIAGKTGTTNDNADGWFVGIVPNLVGGAWTGGEDRSIRFKSNLLGQGSNMALPIWARFMKKVYADSTLNVSQEPFEKPLNFNLDLNCDDTVKQKVRKDDWDEEFLLP